MATAERLQDFVGNASAPGASSSASASSDNMALSVITVQDYFLINKQQIERTVQSSPTLHGFIIAGCILGLVASVLFVWRIKRILYK